MKRCLVARWCDGTWNWIPWNSFLSASGKRGHTTRLDFGCLFTGFYAGFMRRQMEEKHDWHVFIVNVHNSTIVLCRPAGIFFSGHISYHLSFAFLYLVSSSDNVQRYFSRYSGGLNARRHTTRRGIMLSSTQPAILPYVMLHSTRACHALSFPCETLRQIFDFTNRKRKGIFDSKSRFVLGSKHTITYICAKVLATNKIITLYYIIYNIQRSTFKKGMWKN